jgi:hypothetical protein
MSPIKLMISRHKLEFVALEWDWNWNCCRWLLTFSRGNRVEVVLHVNTSYDGDVLDQLALSNRNVDCKPIAGNCEFKFRTDPSYDIHHDIFPCKV